MDTRAITALAKKADALAVRHGYGRETCPICAGSGQCERADDHAPGATLTDRCSQCRGVGDVWFANSEGFAKARGRAGGLLSAEELVRRIVRVP